MDENRTDFFSNTPDDTVSHGADSVQPPLSEQTDAVVSMKQEQDAMKKD